MLELFKQDYLRHLENTLAPQQLAQPLIEAEAQIEVGRLDFDENAMGGLNDIQELAVQQLRAKYQDTLNIMGVNDVLQGIKGYLAQEYLKNPAQNLGTPVPLNEQRDFYNQVYNVEPPLYNEVGNYDPNYMNVVDLLGCQKRALYQHKIYSALTIFQQPNYLIAPNAQFTHVDEHNRPDRIDISDDSKELLALLWLALQDQDFAYDPDFNAETATSVFINTLAGIARAHNFDHGNDDLQEYKPSCPAGISSRLIKEYFQLVKAKSPLENPLDANLLRDLFREKLVAHNEKKSGVFDRIDKLNTNALHELIEALNECYIMLGDFKDLSKKQQFLLSSIQWPIKTMDAFIDSCFERFGNERIVAQRNPQVQFQGNRFNNYGQLITHFLTHAHRIFVEQILAKAQNRLERLERENNQPFGNLNLEPFKKQLAPVNTPIEEGALALGVNHRAYIGQALSNNEQRIINNLKNRYQAAMNQLDHGIEGALLEFKAHLIAEYRARPAATPGMELNAATLLTDDFASISQSFERKADGRIYLKDNQAILDGEIIENENNPGHFVFIETHRDTRAIRLMKAEPIPVTNEWIDINVNPRRLNEAQKVAILNHPIHSALRYLFHGNDPLLSPNAHFTTIEQGKRRPEMYPQARELIAFLWIALNDPGYQLKDNLTKKQGIDFLVQSLHNINRVYSHNETSLDDPSCPGGGLGRLVRECFVAIRELEPQERMLSENTFLEQFKSLLIVSNDHKTGLFDTIEKLPLATLRTLFSALESLCITLEVDSFNELPPQEKKAVQQLAWSAQNIQTVLDEMCAYYTKERIVAQREPQLKFQGDRFDNFGALFIHLCENAIEQFSAELYNKIRVEKERKEAANPQPLLMDRQRLAANQNPPRRPFVFAPNAGGPRI